MIWALVALGTLAVLESVALAVVAARFVLLRRRHERLVRSIQPAPSPSVVVAGAQKAVQVAVKAATRLRSGGVSGLLAASLDDVVQWAVDDRGAIAQVATPEGLVTFVFTDIVDSTATNELVGDRAWVRVLAAHEQIVQAQVARHHGHVVKSQGDGFMIVFGAPATAVDAARDIQLALTRHPPRALRSTPVHVRMGLHTGTAVSRDGDYFGRNVAMAARVAAQARGGEILVSSDTWDALPDRGTVDVQDTREAALKGLTGTHVLRAIAWG